MRSRSVAIMWLCEIYRPLHLPKASVTRVSGRLHAKGTLPRKMRQPCSSIFMPSLKLPHREADHYLCTDRLGRDHGLRLVSGRWAGAALPRHLQLRSERAGHTRRLSHCWAISALSCRSFACDPEREKRCAVGQSAEGNQRTVADPLQAEMGLPPSSAVEADNTSRTAGAGAHAAHFGVCSVFAFCRNLARWQCGDSARRGQAGHK